VESFYENHKPEHAESILSFLAVLHDPIIAIKENGKIVQVNKKAQELFGYHRNEFLEMTVEDLLPSRLRQLYSRFREIFLKKISTGPVRKSRKQYALFNRMGEKIYVEVFLSPIIGPEGNITIATIRDVTTETVGRRALINVMKESFSKTRQDFFDSLALFLARDLKAQWVAIGKLAATKDAIQTISFLSSSQCVDNICYPLAGMPCNATIKNDDCLILDQLYQTYPNTLLLAQQDGCAHAYVGVCLYSSSGEILGLINVLYDAPIDSSQAELARHLLRIVALRVAPEIEILSNQESLSKLSAVVESSPNAVVITDRETRIEYVNPRYCEMSGYIQEELIGKKMNINSSGNTPKKTYNSLWRKLGAGDQWQGELENARKDGSTYWARSQIFPIKDQDGCTINFVGIQEDISKARALTKQLKYEVSHDHLTGLANRKAFELKLDQAVSAAKQNGSIHSLCFIDLDHFKVLNDTGGHLAGDLLLKGVGQVLKGGIRAKDVAARLGGDEFGLILFDCDSIHADKIVSNILNSIQKLEFVWDDKSYVVGASIGIVEVSGHEHDSAELLKQVDVACYSAKEQGKNRIHFYHEGSQGVSRHRTEVDWVPKINAALADDLFRIYLQPIVPLKRHAEKIKGEVCHFEVLIRLPDGVTGEIISPASFLPSVERFNQSARLDRYVINKVFDWIKCNPKRIQQIGGFSINLSGASIADQSLLDFIIAELESGSIAPGKIKFEVTETATIRNIAEACYFMKSIRATGAQVVLDDFGSGFSSFPYLKSLPIDMLKIDGSMVKDIAKDKASYTMVKMINDLAHALGFQTVAEYVESKAILDVLIEIGVDYAQGYEIARPAPLEDVLRE
tara:strand:- start:726 stop:3287 length:2562 start_codon:yes stop_codon:yes gene_type:complete